MSGPAPSSDDKVYWPFFLSVLCQVPVQWPYPGPGSGPSVPAGCFLYQTFLQGAPSYVSPTENTADFTADAHKCQKVFIQKCFCHSSDLTDLLYIFAALLGGCHLNKWAYLLNLLETKNQWDHSSPHRTHQCSHMLFSIFFHLVFVIKS